MVVLPTSCMGYRVLDFIVVQHQHGYLLPEFGTDMRSSSQSMSDREIALVAHPCPPNARAISFPTARAIEHLYLIFTQRDFDRAEQFAYLLDRGGACNRGRNARLRQNPDQRDLRDGRGG